MKHSVFQCVEFRDLKTLHMKAAVFHKPENISYTTVADPRIELA
ncbi:hypothetical protein N824_29620 [Pedobacter sp. V48]|nr:hypothetical protein N824_29620 [Pedobacter sp. V48]